MIIRHSLLLVVLSCSIAACAGSVPRVDAPKEQVSNARAVPAVNPKPDDNATRGIIRVAQDVRRACGLADSEAFFAFDSSLVRFEDKKGLRALANCFMSGPLKGRQMSLIGHADPRGSGDYNLALGGRRADNVKRIIVAESMVDSRVSTTSRGEMDATGTDEASWATDRSVDVTLGN
ncbi:MAG: OmpA family protein [Acidobacteriota bacterium]